MDDFFDYIHKISPVVAGKYKRLNRKNKAIANKGINRHITSCQNIGCRIEIFAIHEIVNDARNGRAVYAE